MLGLGAGTQPSQQPTQQTTLPFPQDSSSQLVISEPPKSWAILRGNFCHEELFQDTCTIGRHSKCNIVIPKDMAVSNQHCIISRLLIENNHIVRLEDTSSNGTRVNGKLLGKGQCVILMHSDHVEIIPRKFYFIFYDTSKPFMSLLPGYESVNNSFEKYFLLDRILGRGASGIVKLAVEKETGVQLACKIIILTDKEKSRKSLLEHHLQQEIKIMTSINHLNLVQVYNIYDELNYTAIFMEFVDGGDLYSYIEGKLRLDEGEARFHTFQLLQGLKYLHSKNITHRDLKPENILIEKRSPYPRIVISDFGLAKVNIGQTILKTQCGTIGFIAPEIASGMRGYTNIVDCWSLGVVIYNMFSGYMPFPEASDSRFSSVDVTTSHPIHFSSSEWRDISVEAKQIICLLLCKDPKSRLSVDQALKHPWISEFQIVIDEMYEHLKLTTHTISTSTASSSALSS